MSCETPAASRSLKSNGFMDFVSCPPSLCMVICMRTKWLPASGLKNPTGEFRLRPLIRTVRLNALAHGCGEHAVNFAADGVLLGLAAAGELVADDDERDELVEIPAKPAHHGMKMIKAMIPTQPISPFRQKCPFFLTS